RPHRVRHVVPVELDVLRVARHRVERLAEAPPVHADLGRYGRVVVQPYILPLAVRSAPVGAVLPFVLARARGDEPEAVDRGLDLHDLALLRSIPPLDRVDLPRERVEPGPLALL